MIAFWVPGIPAPGGSKKVFVINGKARLVDAAGQRNKDWRSAVALACRVAYQGKPLAGPLRVTMTFYMPRPKSHYGKNGLRASAPDYPTTRPDTLKLARSTEDALTGIAWDDDAQTVVLELMKLYSDAQAGADIQVEEVVKGE